MDFKKIRKLLNIIRKLKAKLKYRRNRVNNWRRNIKRKNISWKNNFKKNEI